MKMQNIEVLSLKLNFKGHQADDFTVKIEDSNNLNLMKKTPVETKGSEQVAVIDVIN